MAKQNNESEVSVETPETDSVGKTRSPNYPVYKLETALTKAKTLYEAYRQHPAPLKPALDKLGFKNPGSSTAGQAVAALKAFGLIDVQGAGDARKITVAESAAKIIANHPDRTALLKAAALAPKIHAELFKKFVGKDGVAPDDTIKHYLVFDRTGGRFNDQSVDPFLRQFKSTLSFAGLSSSVNMPEEDDEDGGLNVSVGDFVQWSPQGVAQFQKPRRVVGVTEDGEYAFVEGSATGVPVNQLSIETPANLDRGNAPPLNPFHEQETAKPGTKQEVFALDSGQVLVQWPESITQADFDDIDGWIDILKRKIKRGIKRDDAEVDE